MPNINYKFGIFGICLWYNFIFAPTKTSKIAVVIIIIIRAQKIAREAFSSETRQNVCSSHICSPPSSIFQLLRFVWILRFSFDFGDLEFGECSPCKANSNLHMMFRGTNVRPEIFDIIDFVDKLVGDNKMVNSWKVGWLIKLHLLGLLNVDF